MAGKNTTKKESKSKAEKYAKKREAKAQKKAEKEAAQEVDSEEAEEQEFAELEAEAKMLKETEGQGSSEDEGSDENDRDDAAFLAQGEDLDLPEEDSEDQEDQLKDDSDSDLDDYYEELGIQNETDFTAKEEGKYKTKKKKEQQVDKKAPPKPSPQSLMIDKLIDSCKKEPNFKNVSRIIKIARQIFNKEEEKKTDKPKQVEAMAKGLNSSQYKKIFDFFLEELPALALKVVGISTDKAFKEIDDILSMKHKSQSKNLKQKFSIKKIYGGLNAKGQLLLKTYAANFNKLLKQSIEDAQSSKGDQDSSQFSRFFISGLMVVKVCLPFKIYARKLSNNMSKLVMQYSKVSPNTQILIFNALYHMIAYLQATGDESYFEKAVRKMYLEFTKESKIGGGGHQVQNQLRMAQNCFVEILGLNLPSAYQLGFVFIRQLCLHIRNIRNNLNAEAVKAIYSWQFFNCLKIWVLALGQHQSELVLLIHPLTTLMSAVIKLTSSIKYFPYHIKVLQLLRLIAETTGEFMPISQYILQPLENSTSFFNQKPKALDDKIIPETLVSIKIAKKHVDTSEMKERIIKETLDELLLYLSANSRSISFPEMAVPISLNLRKFKKNSVNANYRKLVTNLLDIIQANSEFIQGKRQIFFYKDKNTLKSDNIKKWNLYMRKLSDKSQADKLTPLEAERKKYQKRLDEAEKLKNTDVLKAKKK